MPEQRPEIAVAEIALAIEAADIDAREFVAGENPFASEAL